MSNTYILYNDKKIPEPSPFVLLERENLYYNQYWGNSDKITLQGQITGYGCSPFNEIISGQEKVLNIFDKNFGNINIYESYEFNNSLDINPSFFNFSNITPTGVQYYGFSTSINNSGNIVAIGSKNFEKVFIFYEKNNWQIPIELTGDQEDIYSFGHSINLNGDGNMLVVGARNNKLGSGEAYLYTGNDINWNFVKKFTGISDQKYFGNSVSLNNSGNILGVGASARENEIITTGLLYIYTGLNDDWNLVNILTGSGISKNFGNCFKFNSSGDIGVVGDYYKEDITVLGWIITGNGSAWDKAIRLTGGQNTVSYIPIIDNSVAINSLGDTVIIGDPIDNNFTGTAWIFTGKNNTWNLNSKLSVNDGPNSFGYSVGLNSSGDLAFIGAPQNQIAPSVLGSIWIFKKENNNWNRIGKITELAGGRTVDYINSFFGNSLSVNSFGNRLAVGQLNAKDQSGAATILTQDQNYEKIYENSGIIIRSINFDDSNYAGVVDYSIELNSIRVSGNVLDPVNEFQFSENENKTVTLSHNISAKGINTSLNPTKSNALNNAISFVRSNTGLANVPSTRFISGDINKFYLQNFSESIDRLNGAYSVQETYINNYLHNNLSGNLTYTLDINSGSESNFIQINLRGQYKGPKNGNISDLRDSLNVTGLITGAYSGYFNSTPIQYNITENTGENSINFDYSFDNINLPNPYYRYESNISKDELQQIYNVQVRGEIVARGNRNYRYFLSTGNIINLTGQFISVASGILTGFKDFNGDTYQSNLRLLNIIIDENPNDGTVSANASYDDKFMPSGDATDASYNISVEAPRWYMNNQPTCNIKGFHIINDFDITTLPKLSINTSLKYKNLIGLNNENTLRSNIKNITNNIVPNNYNFNTKLQDSESYNKKINNFNSITEISYKLDKVDLSNQNGLLPKFNTI